MKSIFYFEQNYHDINILDSNFKVIFKAKRQVNWLGKVKTIIENEKIGKIEGTFYRLFFFKKYEIIKSTKLKAYFINNKMKLNIGDFTIINKNVNFFDFNSKIYVNNKFPDLSALVQQI